MNQHQLALGIERTAQLRLNLWRTPGRTPDENQEIERLTRRLDDLYEDRRLLRAGNQDEAVARAKAEASLERLDKREFTSIPKRQPPQPAPVKAAAVERVQTWRVCALRRLGVSRDGVLGPSAELS